MLLEKHIWSYILKFSFLNKFKWYKRAEILEWVNILVGEPSDWSITTGVGETEIAYFEVDSGA